MGLPCGVFNETYAQDMAIVRTRVQWAILMGFLALVFLFPLTPWATTPMLSLFNRIGIAVIAVLGLNILIGGAGQISLGQSAFVAVGAYASAILANRFGLPFWAALPSAGLITGIIGLFFGLPSLRIKGFYLALATIAAFFIIYYGIVHLTGLTGGTSGYPVPYAKIGNFTFNTDYRYYYVVMPVVVLMTFFAKNIARTKAGRAFEAIRDNDTAAEAVGINLFTYKLLAFFIASVFAGVAGSLWAHNVTASLHPEYFSLWLSVEYVGMLIIGGMGSITGTILGVVAFEVLREVVDIISPVLAAVFPAVAATAFAALGQIVFGLVIILFLIFEPRGLYHRWMIFKASYRLHPFSY